ncbi:E3 ubiquitin-protein ligase bre1 [Elasticomyces elasticus]|nr:E3 ubiquitin-protein ligase bre1 [Elasticomyces elasticus]
MDDRKRSLVPDVDDAAHPSKRQATVANGAQPRMEPETEKDIENFQKAAILRQMREYKREKSLLEAQVAEMTKSAAYHDDHLRTIDAWFSQLLDEVRVIAKENLPEPRQDEDEVYITKLDFKDIPLFETHLKSRSGKIRSAITEIFSRIPSMPPEVTELQKSLTLLLASEKEHIIELQRVASEKDVLNERLENASYRYLVAEKKLDRAKSAAVQKIERQAVLGGVASESGSGSNGKSARAAKKEESADVNGELENGVVSAVAESARKEAVVIAEKRKQQLDQLETENKKLTDELTLMNAKFASLSDDDYAKTELFKLFKSQHEDVIKRINDLEATNVQLREEAQRMHAERIAYRSQVDDEARASSNEVEGQIARAETDLARIRNSRDELSAEIAIRKASQDQNKLSIEQAQELASARDSRIAALESEVERLRLQLGEIKDSTISESTDHFSADDLHSKLRTLESQYSLLSAELPSMETAWKKTQALAAKKVTDIANWEDQLSRISAEKAKADQKYFAAMKAKDSREAECRTLRAQNSKSSEIVTQLKEAEAGTRNLAVNLEKQLAEAKDSLAVLQSQIRAEKQKVVESGIVTGSLKIQISEMKKQLAGKDAAALAASNAKRVAEVELEQCKVRLEDSTKSLESLKKKSVKAEVVEEDQWRRIAICPVCNSHLRNTVLKLCSHVFCQNCVQNLISNRSRKCPSCGKAFGSNDHMPVVLT